MPSYVLDIAIKANDQASQTVKSVDSEFNNLASTVGKTLVAGLAVGGAALVGFGVKALQMGSDAAETKSKFNAVFKDMSKEVGAWSDKVASSMGLTKAQSKGMLASIQDLLVPLGLTRTKAADLSKQTLQLAGDLASFDNLNTADVVNDINSALVGETEPMKKYGVVLNENAIKAKALSMGLADVFVDQQEVARAQLAAEQASIKYTIATEKYGETSREARKAQLDYNDAVNKLTEAQHGHTAELNAAQKAQAALALIMDSTKDAQGDLAKTQDGFANQWRKTQSLLAQTATDIGEMLLPTFTTLVTAFNEWAQTTLPGIVTGIGTQLTNLQTAWNDNWGDMKSTVDTFTSVVPSQLSLMWGQIDNIFSTNQTKIEKGFAESFIGTLLNDVTRFVVGFTNSMTSGFHGIDLIGDAFEALFKGKWTQFWKDLTDGLWSMFIKPMMNMYEFLTGKTPLNMMPVPEPTSGQHGAVGGTAPISLPSTGPIMPHGSAGPLSPVLGGVQGSSEAGHQITDKIPVTINVYGGDVNAVTNAITDTLRSNGVRP